MKLLLKADNKTIEFLEGSETINVNDDFVQSITVVAEAPLTAREQLAVVYEDTVSEDTTHNVGLVKSDEGYYSLIPQGVINAGGTWTFQIMRRRYSTDGTKYTETASYKYELTVGEGVKNAEGQVVTTAEIMSLYEVVEKQYIRKDGGTMQNPLVVENPRAVDKTTVASDGIHIGTETSEVHYGKGFIVDKYGETETVYGLPTEGGALVTEGIARTLAQEEIAKYDFIKIVEELPDKGLPNRIYLVPHEAEEGSNDLFDMWLWVNDAWEFEGTKSAEIEDARYVKLTDIGDGLSVSNGKVIVNIHNNYGLTIGGGGLLMIKNANNAEIEGKDNAFKPITPKNVDHAVKVGITTNTETLTDEEKAAALDWLGVTSGDVIDGERYIVAYEPQSKKVGYKRAYATYFGGSYTVMLRDGNGFSHGKTATAESAGTVLINKEYVDNNFVPKQITSGLMKVYGNDTNGEVTMFTIRQAGQAVAGTHIPQTDANGVLHAITPTADDNGTSLVTKDYAEGGFVAKRTDTTTYNQVYMKGSGGNQIMANVTDTLVGSTIPMRLASGGILVPQVPTGKAHAASKGYVDDNKGTKLYKHTISGFVGGTGVIDITSITLISTSNTEITGASDLDLQYTQYGISANTAYGKVVNIVQTMTDEITMQFHSRPAGGEVETVELDASSITDTVEAL